MQTIVYIVTMNYIHWADNHLWCATCLIYMQDTTTPLCTPMQPCVLQSTSSSASSLSDLPRTSGVQMKISIGEMGIGLAAPTEVSSRLYVSTVCINI